jgi:hypothetical protein
MGQSSITLLSGLSKEGSSIEDQELQFKVKLREEQTKAAGIT